MMRIFLTGATGFAGSYLVDQLLEQGHEVWALVRSMHSAKRLPQLEKVHTVQGDLLDVNSLKAAVAKAKPDVVYHLAGQAYPVLSWKEAARTININTAGTANLLDAVVAYGRPKVIVVTSAEIYGKVTEAELPLTEQSKPEPRHPYGVSKAAAGQLVPVYHSRYDLPVIEARPFNHIGPRQALGFVVPDFASQIAAISLGQREPCIKVGNLSSQRDFTDVRDIVRSYQLLAEHGTAGEAYLVCSGKPVAISSIMDTLIDLSGQTVTIEQDPERMRPSDVPILYGDYSKIQQHTGWHPTLSLQDTLSEALDEWMMTLQKSR